MNQPAIRSSRIFMQNFSFLKIRPKRDGCWDQPTPPGGPRQKYRVMIELAGTSSALRIKSQICELVGEEDRAGPFVRFEPDHGGKDASEEKERQRQARRFEYALLNSESPDGLNARKPARTSTSISTLMSRMCRRNQMCFFLSNL